jgi:hypothetical protein
MTATKAPREMTARGRAERNWATHLPLSTVEEVVAMPCVPMGEAAMAMGLTARR